MYFLDYKLKKKGSWGRFVEMYPVEI